MAICNLCGKESPLIGENLPLCRDCISRDSPGFETVQKIRAASRERVGLPGMPPWEEGAPRCSVCVNECRIGPGEKGYCGLRTNQGGGLVNLAGTRNKGVVTWYHDPLPSNCVADWVCPAGTGAGYPRYAYDPRGEWGYNNLAVFLGACSFDCLYCQNHQYRHMAASLSPLRAPRELTRAVKKNTSCICFFGGDPSPQLPFTIKASRVALEENPGRILRICWETNGTMHPTLLKRICYLALETGGCIKFDLKAWREDLHRALTGVTNGRTLQNFAYAASYLGEREEPPFLVASTLLVPGYVEKEEVGALARFIARFSPHIPYSLLAFYPCHLLYDLPTTSRRQAEECREAALEAGLTRVRLGNVHLLS